MYEFNISTARCCLPRTVSFPHPDANYKDQVYTTGSAGFYGFKHIERKPGQPKDFSEIIEHAKDARHRRPSKPEVSLEDSPYNQVFALADKVVEAVKSGAIRKFFVSRCDGRMKGREYYTEFFQKLPKDTVIRQDVPSTLQQTTPWDINGIPKYWMPDNVTIATRWRLLP